MEPTTRRDGVPLVERAKRYKSKQPRFENNTDSAGAFMSLYQMYHDTTMDTPPYAQDSRKLDAWLRNWWHREPQLAGVVNSVIDIDKNRGWRMVGGRNLVNKFTDMFHNFKVGPGLQGWRPGISFLSESFWTSNMGGLVEFGRDGRNGPLAELWNMDPTRCYLTGNVDAPLRYVPPSGSLTELTSDDYIRVSSLPSTDESMRGLGYCAVMRCIELTKLIMAIYGHHQESLGAKAPRGLLLLQGIGDKAWKNAMKAREASNSENGYRYFDAVAVLASMNASVDAKLIALSQLPEGFNFRDWLDILMYGYALSFAYDASEFWPVQYGALGRGNETQIQHEKATGKGRLDFVLGFEEQITNYLPPTIDFTFDQRDEQGDLVHASVYQAWATVGKTLYEAGQQTRDGSLVGRDEVRYLLANAGILPRTWTRTPDVETTDEDGVDDDPAMPEDAANTIPAKSPGTAATATNGNPTGGQGDGAGKSAVKPTKIQAVDMDSSSRDMRILRSYYSDQAFIRRAAETFPKEPIVVYEFDKGVATEIVLWRSGNDLLHPRVHRVAKIETEEDLKIKRLKNITPPTINMNVNIPSINLEYPIVEIPAEPPAQITVNVPKPDPVVVNVQQAAITLPKPDPVIVNVTVPEQQAIPVPAITFSPQIAMPEQPISINVPPAQVVINTPDAPKKDVSVVRDAKGKIVRMIEK